MIFHREIMKAPNECIELPRTADSIPFGAADRLVEPINLANYGFEEREFLIKGFSHVYEWNEGEKQPTIQTESAPYCTKALVRLPSNPEDFSGTVVVELLNWASKYDRPIPGWGQCFEYYLSRNIAWIGLSVRDVALEAAQRFDPIRYADLGFKNPKPEELRGTPATSYGKTNLENENGLIWDAISEFGILLKSDSNQNPLHGYNVKNVIATGATAGDLSAYIAGFHPMHRTSNNEPIYDGFLMYMTGAPGGVNQETNKNSETDPRNLYYSEVPFIHVLTTGDMLGGGFHPDWAFMQRRPDADETAKKLVRYEIAGCGVRSGYDKHRCVCQEDVEKSNTPWKESVNYLYEYPVRYILRAANECLIKWIEDGITPPHSPLLETTGSYPDAEYIRDVAGNTCGGIRLPYVDVPLYRFNEEGGAERLSADTIKVLYHSKEEYLEKVIDSCFKAVEGRWLLPEDAKKIIIEASNEPLSELEEE